MKIEFFHPFRQHPCFSFIKIDLHNCFTKIGWIGRFVFTILGFGFAINWGNWK